MTGVSWHLQHRQWNTVQGKENKDFGPDTRSVGESVDTKRFEGADDNKDSSPAVIQGEREMHEELITVIRWSVVLLDDVIDVLENVSEWGHNGGIRERVSYSHCGANKQSKDEGYNRH